jgi:methylated-DNA-[protein]-cysteine S-methyltransferase
MPSSNPSPLVLRRFRLATPTGVLVLLQDADDALRVLEWDDNADRLTRLLHRYYGSGCAIADGDARSSVAVRALEQYFAGDLAALDALPVATTTGSEFQRRVWRALREIPAGTTISYAELARRVGKPSAFRAVGLANGANPIGIVVPCHRVIGSDGSLTGYGGGIDRKRWLLMHEGALPAAAFAASAGRAPAADAPRRRQLALELDR